MESVAYEELLQRDGQVITHVVGSSMQPLLYNRESIVIVEAADRVPPKVKDIVLYKTGETYILHRVMRIQPDEYLIRGDNTWVIEHVPKTALLATMTGFYRKPNGKLITREHLGYRIYLFLMPWIREAHKTGSKVKRTIRKWFHEKK